MNLFGRQGFPTPYFVDVFTNDPFESMPFIQIGPAARFRTPDVYVLDLQVSRVFRVGPSVTVIPQLACFNVLNSRTVLKREGQVGTYDASATPAFRKLPAFNDVSSTLSARVFRGGVRVEF